MKKMAAWILCLTFLISFGLFAQAAFPQEDACTLTADGTLTEYAGAFDDVLTIRPMLNGICIAAIGDGVFAGKPVGTVYLHDGIKKLGASCFAESTLNYIDIPSNVETIGEEAFKNCKQLTSLSLGSDKVSFGRNAFAGTGYLHIAVPCISDFLSLHDYIRDAKGDEEFTYDIMHEALTESMVEKDAFGHSMIVCSACGFKGSMYSDDTPLPFTDVLPDAWYYPYVQTAYTYGILNGKSEAVFDPNANMTLAEAAKIAACLYGYQLGADVGFLAAQPWYQPYVDYCYETGIIDSHVSFAWEENATRAEMAYLFARADMGENEINPDVPLTDIPDVDEKTSFYDSILALYRRGIATGSDEYYTYYPDANVTRAEAATFVSRILCFDMRVDLPKG